MNKEEIEARLNEIHEERRDLFFEEEELFHLRVILVSGVVEVELVEDKPEGDSQ